jgi:hypothetical protein
MNFKANIIIEFESDCIKNARSKLDEILKEIVEETLVTKVYVDETKERLFI